MITLLDTLTDEPHSWSPDFTWYSTVDRVGPDGAFLEIEVEVGVDWDGTPKPETRGWCKVTKNIDIGNGLMIRADTFIMLDEVEQDDFLYCQEARDWMKAEEEGAADVKHHNEYYDANR